MRQPDPLLPGEPYFLPRADPPPSAGEVVRCTRCLALVEPYDQDAHVMWHGDLDDALIGLGASYPPDYIDPTLGGAEPNQP